jgi:flagellar FliL protein
MAEPEEVEAPQEPEAPKKGKLKLWIIMSGGLLLLGSVGFLTRNYLVGSKGKAEVAKEAEKVKSIMNLDSFLVNLADPETRFIKVTFRLGLNENKLGDELKDDPVTLAATRDAIISCLSTKTSDELLSPEGKEKLKKDIRELVSKVLPKGKVIEVYIMDFVVQL